MQCSCMAAHSGSLSLYHKTPRRDSNKHGYHFVFVDDVVISLLIRIPTLILVLLPFLFLLLLVLPLFIHVYTTYF